MSPSPVQYFDRYSGRVETEEIYGEAWLRWTYGNPLGRLALHALVKRSAFSRWYGWRMDSPASRAKVIPFVRRYSLKDEEFLEGFEHGRAFGCGTLSAGHETSQCRRRGKCGLR